MNVLSIPTAAHVLRVTAPGVTLNLLDVEAKMTSE